MGLRGPAPLPNSQRTADRADRRLDVPEGGAVEGPPPDTTWHPEAQVWYLALAGTPQAGSYTRSDWGHAHVSAALLSQALRSGDVRAALAVVESAGQRLMTTRAARLAARLDADEQPPGDAAEVVDLPTTAELRARTFGAAGA